MIEPSAVVKVAVIPDSVYVGHFTYINGDVSIGDYTLIGPHCSITSNVHIYDGKAFNILAGKKIKIGSGCWIAAGCQIIAGVTIGNGCLVCANSTVTKDVPDNTIVAGVPAHVVGTVRAGGLDWL